ncbi:MAG: hypothetical protein JW807_15115 [Spirochaetes bacterium]|nr:hypothetical protein [Spirochaetota bacterium]
MLINKTMESISYRDMFHTGLEKTPKFIRRTSPAGSGSESDIVEISEDARRRLMEKNSSPLVKVVGRLSREISELILNQELSSDAERRNRTGELRERVLSGSYDFDSAAGLEMAGKAVTAQLIGRDR